MALHAPAAKKYFLLQATILFEQFFPYLLGAKKASNSTIKNVVNMEIKRDIHFTLKCNQVLSQPNFRLFSHESYVLIVSCGSFSFSRFQYI